MYENTLANKAQMLERNMAWVVDEAEKELTAPSIDALYEAAEKAGIGEDGIDWTNTLLVVFLELSRQRPRSNGPQPITYQEVVAYQIANDPLKLHPIEVSVIMLLDQVFMSFVYDCAAEKEQQLRERANQGA